MQIVSVIPSTCGLSTNILAKKDEDSLPVNYSYSHSSELIRDPKDNGYMQWNGGTLTEAIQFVISL